MKYRFTDEELEILSEALTEWESVVGDTEDDCEEKIDRIVELRCYIEDGHR